MKAKPILMIPNKNAHVDDSNFVTQDYVYSIIAKGERFKDPVFPPETMIHGINRLNNLPPEK